MNVRKPKLPDLVLLRLAFKQHNKRSLKQDLKQTSNFLTQ